MKTENKEKLICMAIEMLGEADIDQLETVEVNETSYDDGSVRLSIELVYPTELIELQTAFSLDMGSSCLKGVPIKEISDEEKLKFAEECAEIFMRGAGVL